MRDGKRCDVVAWTWLTVVFQFSSVDFVVWQLDVLDDFQVVTFTLKSNMLIDKSKKLAWSTHNIMDNSSFKVLRNLKWFKLNDDDDEN